MAVSDRESIMVVKDMGLVTAVFDERTLSSLQGDLALGHVRYSTTGPSTWHNAQPVYRSIGAAGFALGHNGNLTNTRVLMAEAGMLPGIETTDSDLIAELLAREQPPDREPGSSAGPAESAGPANTPSAGPADSPPARRTAADSPGPADDDGPDNHLEVALSSVLPLLEGAFSLGLMDAKHLVAVRDPHGFRPLCLGRWSSTAGRRDG